MAPTISAITSLLDKRQYYNGYCDGYGYYYSNNGCYYSGWNAWGRWVLLAVIIVFAFLVYLIFSCITARRRKRAGQNPLPLTGWAYRPGNNNNGQYSTGYGYQNQQNGYTAPPAYGQQQQQYGVQQPQAVYNNASRDADNTGHYAPPAGPPPGKKGDGVIR